MDPLFITFRWIHVASIVIMVGGAFFIRFVLLPTAATLPDEPHRLLRAGVMKRWYIVLRACMVLILASGVFNFVAVTRPLHAGGDRGTYDLLVGIKVGLALAIFGIAEALVRKDPTKWLTVNLLIAMVVIAISSTLKFMPPTY